jgi:hypothetical protein
VRTRERERGRGRDTAEAARETRTRWRRSTHTSGDRRGANLPGARAWARVSLPVTCAGEEHPALGQGLLAVGAGGGGERGIGNDVRGLLACLCNLLVDPERFLLREARVRRRGARAARAIGVGERAQRAHGDASVSGSARRIEKAHRLKARLVREGFARRRAPCRARARVLCRTLARRSVRLEASSSPCTGKERRMCSTSPERGEGTRSGWESHSTLSAGSAARDFLSERPLAIARRGGARRASSRPGPR